MKKLIFFCLSCIVSFQLAAQQADKISVSGNKFVNSRGEAMIFRGMSSSDPEKLYSEGRWNDRYFAEVKNWGANIIRFPVHPLAWRKLGPSKYLELLDEGLSLAAKYGIYVIIDWHSIGNICTEKFSRDIYVTSKAETKAFWETVAARYKNNPTLAFLELFNEPTIDGGKLGECSWADWKKFMEEIITTIRATGNTAIPLVAGFNWAYDLGELRQDPIAAEGIGYVSHPYPQKRPKPWEEKWTEDWGFAAEKYPLILTEIGFCGPEDPGAHIPVISDESYGDAITAYCQDRGISYLVWVFDNSWSPRMFTDWNFSPSQQGQYFKNAFKKKLK